MADATRDTNGYGDMANIELLSRDEIFAADDIRYEFVPVPEWGGQVRIRSLEGTERGVFEQSLQGDDPKQKASKAKFRERLAALSIVDRNGRRVFGDEDIAKLGKKSAIALGRVADAATKLSFLSKEDVEALADDLGKTTGDDS